MPVLPSLVLTNQLPINTYTASVVTSASVISGVPWNLIADGLGNQITMLAVTASFAQTASVQTSWEESSSFASQSFTSMSSSWASQSFNAITASYASSSNWSVSSSFTSQSFSSATSSWSSQSFSSSWSATSSQFSPSQGSVTDAGPLTGSVSSSGYGFTTDVEFNNFVTDVSASMQQFNSLLAKLRAAGVIS